MKVETELLVEEDGLAVAGTKADDASYWLPSGAGRVVHDTLRDANGVAGTEVVGIVAVGMCACSRDYVENLLAVRVIMWWVMLARIDEDDAERLLRFRIALASLEPLDGPPREGIGFGFVGTCDWMGHRFPFSRFGGSRGRPELGPAV